MRRMQDGIKSSSRSQRPRRLMTVHFTRQVARNTSVDSPERHGAEFEIDALANGQHVQLPPKLNGTGTMRRLCYCTSERVLNSGHAEDGLGCAATYHGADCCSSRDMLFEKGSKTAILFPEGQYLH